MTYIYPVVSRRAGGVSVGINLNPNNACNWRCIYCQVPELKRGTAPAIDLIKLEAELRAFLLEILHSDFMHAQVAPEARRINDIALSGNGEPTSAREFEQVIELIGNVKADYDLPIELKLVLITNGSLIDRPGVQSGLRRMSELNGEVWFKLDSVTREGRQLQIDGVPPIQAESDAYLKFLEEFLREGVPLKGVLLYGLARPSMQPEAARLTKVSPEWMDGFQAQIQALGLPVKLNP
jgi:wyosine [tRNA(Phe)-imidazoG37] synthetase (radical SAM superfamily)